MQKFSRRIEIIGDKIIKNKISLEEFRNVLSKIKWNELSLKFKMKLKERIKNVYERKNRKEIRERKKIERKDRYLWLLFNNQRRINENMNINISISEYQR